MFSIKAAYYLIISNQNIKLKNNDPFISVLFVVLQVSVQTMLSDLVMLLTTIEQDVWSTVRLGCGVPCVMIAGVHPTLP